MSYCSILPFTCLWNSASRELILGLLLMTLAATGCAQPTASKPRLLQDVTAGSGYASACPPDSATDKKTLEIWKGQLAISPEFDQRLRNEFPPGTDSNTLINSLTAQGFVLAGVCKNEPTIQIATFYQKGQGFLPYDTFAQVFWKTNEQGRIIWTKGLVSYSGL